MFQTSEDSSYRLDNGALALMFDNRPPGVQSDSAGNFCSHMRRSYPFDIELQRNFTKQTLEDRVQVTAGREDCSGLFVFIFSRATGGSIVDMEGTAVQFREIEEMMDTANMKRKPKVLCVELVDSDNGHIGGLSNGFEPIKWDFFFVATPGGGDRDFLRDLIESARGDLDIGRWLTAAANQAGRLNPGQTTLCGKVILKDVLPEGEDASELLPTNSSKIGDISVDVLPEGEDASELLPTNSSEIGDISVDVLPEGEDASEPLPTNSSEIGDISVKPARKRRRTTTPKASPVTRSPRGESTPKTTPNSTPTKKTPTRGSAKISTPARGSASATHGSARKAKKEEEVDVKEAPIDTDAITELPVRDRAKLEENFKKVSDRQITFDGCNLPLNMPASTIADCGFVSLMFWNDDERDEFQCLACELILSGLPENECDLVDIHNEWSGEDCEWLRNSNCWQMRRELLQRLQFLLL